MLRQEAQAFSLEELDLEQLGAASRILEMLDEAAAAIPDEKAAEAPRSPWLAMRLDRARRSMVAFLDGARGMGKTSILLTLMRAFDKEVADKQVAPTLADEEADPERKRLLGEVWEKIKLLRDRVIWLETLDLEPVASNTNLLAAILARIERRAQELLRPASRGAFSDEETDALAELNTLMRDVGFAWEGNVRERASSLDPELYAEEVIAAELTRLNFNERLEKVLARLSRQIEDAVRDKVQRPLFVLPVDDLDLNPTFTLDLLRLVRAVYSPRLFTVMLGDMEMTDRVVTARYLGELTQPFGQRVDFGPNGTEDVQIAARETAAHALRKLLPPAQRVDLRPPSFDDAMKYRPKGSGPILGEILEKIPCPWKSPLFPKVTKHPKNFSEYITATGDFKGLWEARRLFETSRRRLADFYDRFKEIADMKDELSDHELEKKLLNQINKITIEAIEEDDLIQVQDRKMLRNLINQTQVEPYDIKYLPLLLSYIFFESRGFRTHFESRHIQINKKIVDLDIDFLYYDYYSHESYYECLLGNIDNSNAKRQICSEFLSSCLALLYSIHQNKRKVYFSNLTPKLITLNAVFFFGNVPYIFEFDWRIPNFSDIKHYFTFSNIIVPKLKKIINSKLINATEYNSTDDIFSNIFDIWVHEAINVATNNRNGYNNIKKIGHKGDLGNPTVYFLASIAINLAPEFGMPENVSRKFLDNILNMIPESDKPKMMSNLQRIRREMWNNIRASQFNIASRDPIDQVKFRSIFDIYNKIQNYFLNAEHPFNDVLEDFLKNQQGDNREESLQPNGKKGQDPEG
jgi:hypothetical protein